MVERQKLLLWFKNNGRSFIWRQKPDPFIVLLSEILLKKTTASAVNNFLPHFIEKYNSLQILDKAPIQEMEKDLSPLGLSKQRAKQLKDLARELINLYSGKIPNIKENLLSLPGIGEYTAGALLSFAFGKPEPIVDTNVARVIVRLYGIKPSHYEARRSPEVWGKAREFIGKDSRNIAKINWALLDLGALVCTPKNPNHNKCPLKTYCQYAKQEDTTKK